MIHLVKKHRRFIVFLYDLFAIFTAYALAFLVRFDFQIPDHQLENFWKGLPYVMAIQAAVFIGHSLYRGMWSYASLKDLALIMRASAIGVLGSVVCLTFLFDRLNGWPRSVFFIQTGLLVLILGGARFFYRFLRENGLSLAQIRKRVLVVGAGQTGDFIAREIIQRSEMKASVIGYLDDDTTKKGNALHGARVLGNLDQLVSVLDRAAVDEVIIAIPSLPGTRIKVIYDEAKARGIPIRIAPPIQDVLMGRVSLSQLREVRVEDLLRRDVVKTDEVAITNFFRGKRVLVTGAGGSIGSELCRQILKTQPSHLILFERTEFNLFRFLNEVNRETNAALGVNVVPVMADILDQRRLEQVFAEYRPQIVVHAAAYKHVPLLEENPYEALQNNVIGSYEVAAMASKYSVDTFLLVSTDKAVRPTNVLGASKRMAERVVNEVGRDSKMKTVSVRFGNVLDSEGSVLPKFREQIASGGPVTITHPEITRYFMTIPEASSLVLQACVLGKGGEIFLLDMGKPVKIRELAEDLIHLSGLKLGRDIEIKFTGLRPGEKLYEELLIDEASETKTSHPKVFVASGDLTQPLDAGWDDVLAKFSQAPQVMPISEMKEWICRWVPEYGPPAHDQEQQALRDSHKKTDPSFLH